MQSSWLTGWKVIRLESPKTPIQVYLFKCKALINFGRQLFNYGVLPELNKSKDTDFAGTNGNFAIRDPFIPWCFLVTARGSHKGYLTEKDFVIVYYIDWGQKRIFINSWDDLVYPSTDSLLIASAFAVDRRIKIWIHFHCPIKTPHKIKLNYPAISKKDWTDFSRVIQNGFYEINLIDHDLLHKAGIPNNKPDSAIILGKYSEETFARAIKFLS